jgi:integrase
MVGRPNQVLKQLNEAAVRGLPVPGKGARIHYFAGAKVAGKPVPRGFAVRITAAGTRSFVLRYRAAHVERLYVIGRHPDWSAAQAAEEARALRRRVDLGQDPLAERRKQETGKEGTLKAVCEEFFRRDGASLRGVEERRRIFERLVYPQLGSRQVDTIKRSELVRHLDKIADENGEVMADRTLAYLRKVLNWFASRSDDYVSPIVRGMARTKGTERARLRVLTDAEIVTLWKVAEASTAPFARLLQFILLTAARRSEAAEAVWDELDGSNWTLPAARNKTKLDLVRPLSKAALAVLPKRSASRFMFSSNGHAPLSGFTQLKAAFDREAGVGNYTIHDLRRTARTLLSRAGVPSDIGERCLGHVIGGVRGVYDRWEFRDEKARAYEALAALVDRIVSPQDNVTELRRATWS